MSKNPLINSSLATLYIVTLVLVMYFGIQKTAGQEDTFIIPIAMISLFTLSAAVMAYLFCFQPIQLYFEGKKKQAVNLFLQTVGVFGITTVLLLILMFSGVIK